MSSLSKLRALRASRAQAASSSSTSTHSSVDCNALIAEYNSAKPHQLCPLRAESQAPEYRLLYEASCSTFGPGQRACAARVPGGYVPPHRDRLWNPRTESVHWPSYPPRRSFGELAARKVGDCVTCWHMEKEAAFWKKYVRDLRTKYAIPLGTELVRTAIDVGAGAGSFLAALQEEHGIQGVGITRDWESLPFLPTMAARGIIGLQVSASARFPFADGAFDLVHSRAAGLRGANSLEELERMLYEWDRVVRPGGYLVCNHWLLEGGGAWQTHRSSSLEIPHTKTDADGQRRGGAPAEVQLAHRTATRLGWRAVAGSSLGNMSMQYHWKPPRASWVDFVFQKPQARGEAARMFERRRAAGRGE